MDEMIQNRMDCFLASCREHGLRLTPQKQEVFRVLASTDAHPTAQEIFEEVRRIFPKISFATVYDNLRKFKEMGLVKEMNLGGNCSRFDANTGHHHHVLCMESGTLMDVELPQDIQIPIPKALEGKAIREIKITYVV